MCVDTVWRIDLIGPVKSYATAIRQESYNVILEAVKKIADYFYEYKIISFNLI